ncbi:MAG: hypothetical protein IJK46_06005 [Prevotella sp.]|nr:hypothetical protein [Prevotella sp.]
MKEQELRERAAIAAMQGLLAGVTSNPTLIENFGLSAKRQGMCMTELISEVAVCYADSLIKRL